MSIYSRLGPWTWRRALALAVVAPWAAWALVRTLGVDALGHPFVSVLAFTPYAALTSVVPVLVAVALRRWAAAGLALLACLALGVAVLPRAVAGQRADADMAGATLTVMSSNLLGGRADARAVMRVAREQDVDVLSLQELTPEAVAALDAAGADTAFPERVVEARPRYSGAAVMARGGLVTGTKPDDTMEPQPIARIRLPFARTVAVKAVHPFPPLSRARTRAWERKIARMPAGGRPDGALPVLAGDFNATLDHHALRGLIDRGYVDAADTVGQGLRPTWPVGKRTPGITIDHVLADRRIAVRDFSVHEIPGSDHRAVVAVLRIPTD